MKNWSKKIFGYGFASLLCDWSHEMTTSLIPTVVGQFVSPMQLPFILGLISSASDGLNNFVRLFSGFISDKIRHKKLIIMIGYALTPIFTTLIGFAHSIGAVFMYRIFAFAGSGLREPPRDAIVATIIEPAHYGRAIGLRNAMDTIGSLIGPVVAFICLGYCTMHEIFALALIPGLLAVVIIFLFTQNISVAPRDGFSFWKDVRLLPHKFIVFLIVMGIFDLGCFNKLLIISRAQEMLAVDGGTFTRWIVLLYALFNVVRSGAEFGIGYVSDYVNRFALLAVCGCGVFAGMSIMLIKPHASFMYCMIIFVLFGISAAAIGTMKKACAADMLPTPIRGLGYGVLEACEGTAALVSSSMVGFLWTWYCPLVAFSYAAILSVVAMFLLFGVLYFHTQKKA